MSDLEPTAGTLVLGGREALARLERAICGLPPFECPARAEGLAAAALDAASLGHGPFAPSSAPQAMGSCVHHALGKAVPPGGSACVLAPGDAQQALDLALVARVVSRTIRRPVFCLHGAYASEIAGVQMPTGPEQAEMACADDSILEVVDAAVERVAAATGRTLGAVHRSGPADAPLALIGAGVAGHAAERLAAALTGAGQPCAAVAVKLVLPVPTGAIGDALQGVERAVVLVDFDDGDLVPLASLREAAPSATLTTARVPAAAPVAALLVAVGSHIGDSMPSLAKATEPPRFIVGVAPQGPWAAQVARGIAGALLSSDDGAAVESQGAGGNSVVISGPATRPTRRVLVLADRRFLDAPERLGGLNAADRIVVVTKSEEADAGIPDAVRHTILDRGLEVALLTTGPDEGADETRARVVSAAVAAALGEANPGVRPLTSDELGAEPAPAEIDFRAAPTGPQAAERADEPEHSALWLRQFHLGRAPHDTPGPALAPVAISALAQGALRRWPAVVVPEADGTTSARALSDVIAAALPNADDRQRSRIEHAIRAGATDEPTGSLAERVSAIDESLDPAGLAAALPAGAQVLDLHDSAPIGLAVDALRGRAQRGRAAFSERLAALGERLRDRLAVDLMRSAESQTAEALDNSLGGISVLDVSRLAANLPAPEPEGRLPDERRLRLERVAATIAAFASSAPAPGCAVVVARDSGIELPEALQPTVTHDTPLEAALGLFDGYSARYSDVIRAARTGELELDDAWQGDVYGPAMDELGWEGFTPAELAALPQVLVVIRAADLRGAASAALQNTLRSGRPVRVLVIDDGPEAPGEFHARAAWQAIAHREAFVLGGSAARPDRWVSGLHRAAASLRPAVLEFWLPAPGPVDWRELRAAAAVAGRSCPDLLFDPEAGPDLADRLDASANPDPDAPWASVSLPLDGDDALTVPLTHLDALAMDPRWRDSFRLLAVEDEATDQLRIEAWIDTLDASVAQPWLPYVPVVHEGAVRRAVATRELALACADRLQEWHAVQEAAGFDNAWARRAAADARERANIEAASELAVLRAEHAAELERVRSDTAREALGRVAQALLDAGAGGLVLGGGAAPAPVAPMEGVPDNGAGVAVAAEPVAAAEPEDDGGGAIVEEAYIDTTLCTSCNECTNMNGRLFQYNADKQAVIADISAGTFAEMVRAAELCPAACIHPGAPRAGDGTVTDDLVGRAAAFN